MWETLVNILDDLDSDLKTTAFGSAILRFNRCEFTVIYLLSLDCPFFDDLNKIFVGFIFLKFVFLLKT
jgi:hypothetical protein